MHLSLLSGSFIFLMVFFAGFIDCIAGGGGMITIPTYLSAGVPPELVLGTNKMVSSIGTLTAVIRLLKSVKVNLKPVLSGILFTFTGAWIGARLSQYLNHTAMVVLLLFVIPSVLILSAKKAYKTESRYRVNGIFFIKLCSIVFIIGAYDGFFGPGTGTFLFLGFMYLLSMSAREAVISAKIMNFVANFGALIYFLISGLIAWPVVVIALPASVLGYQLGAYFVLRANVKRIKLIVVLVLICLMLHLIFSL